MSFLSARIKRYKWKQAVREESAGGYKKDWFIWRDKMQLNGNCYTLRLDTGVRREHKSTLQDGLGREAVRVEPMGKDGWSTPGTGGSDSQPAAGQGETELFALLLLPSHRTSLLG